MNLFINWGMNILKINYNGHNEEGQLWCLRQASFEIVQGYSDSQPFATTPS